MRTDASPFLPRMGFVIVFPFSVHSFNAVESLLLRHIVSFCNTFDTISPVSTDKYIDTVENFDKLLNYLLKKVEKEKMECYILGTKEEAEI